MVSLEGFTQMCQVFGCLFGMLHIQKLKHNATKRNSYCILGGWGRSKKQQPLHLPKLVKKWYSSGVVPNLNGFGAWKMFVSDHLLKVSDQRFFQEGLKQGGIYKTIA